MGSGDLGSGREGHGVFGVQFLSILESSARKWVSLPAGRIFCAVSAFGI